MTDPSGHIVEFIDKNRIILGLVQNSKKNRLAVLTSNDKQLSLPLGRALLLTPAAISSEMPRDAQVEYMASLVQDREDLAAQVDVEQLWELVHEEEEPLSLADLAELQFGNEAGDNHLSGTLRALFYQRLHFRLSGNDFLPLSQEQLEKKLLQQEKEAAHRAEVDLAVSYLNQVRSLPPDAGMPEPPQGLFELLADLVVFAEDAPNLKMTKEIVSLAELGGRKKLFNLLVGLGVFDSDENLPLLREKLPREFSDDVMAACAKVDPAGTLDQDREDLTGLFTFTIDGLYTTDFDDALSFENTPDGGGILGVHITDVAALLEQDGLLDLEARGRGTTLYMPDSRVPMLPPPLSEDALSLRQGQLRPAISTLVEISPEGEVVKYRLCRSVLRVDRRLTYEEADSLLETDQHLAGLQRISHALRVQRGKGGAYFLPLPEMLIHIEEDGEVKVRRVDRDGPSREMVAETAILANQLMARYMSENQIPALYRMQPPPHEPIEEGDPSNLFLHFRQRRLLNRVEITTKPGLHSSLGIQPYTHATSPIRRYLDLVMQRQLGRALTGKEPIYTKKDLVALAMEVDPVVRSAMRVRQARQRYWLLKWMEARRGQKIPALVMEYQVRRWQLLLTDVMMIATIPNRPDIFLEPGQQIQVTVEKADAFDDILRVKLD